MADTDAERSIKRPGCTSMMCFGFFSTLTIALAGLLGCYSAQAAADTSCLPSYTLELVGDIEDMASTQELVTHEHIPFLHEPPTDLQQRIENWRSGPPIVPVAIDNHLIPSDFKSPCQGALSWSLVRLTRRTTRWLSIQTGYLYARSTAA